MRLFHSSFRLEEGTHPNVKYLMVMYHKLAKGSQCVTLR